MFLCLFLLLYKLLPCERTTGLEVIAVIWLSRGALFIQIVFQDTSFSLRTLPPLFFQLYRALKVWKLSVSITQRFSRAINMTQPPFFNINFAFCALTYDVYIKLTCITLLLQNVLIYIISIYPTSQLQLIYDRRISLSQNHIAIFLSNSNQIQQNVRYLPNLAILLHKSTPAYKLSKIVI